MIIYVCFDHWLLICPISYVLTRPIHCFHMIFKPQKGEKLGCKKFVHSSNVASFPAFSIQGEKMELGQVRQLEFSSRRSTKVMHFPFLFYFKIMCYFLNSTLDFVAKLHL